MVLFLFVWFCLAVALSVWLHDNGLNLLSWPGKAVMISHDCLSTLPTLNIRVELVGRLVGG